MDIVSQVSGCIDRQSLLESNANVLVAVSGGADSLSVLTILGNLGYHPTVAHFDHQLRTESRTDAEFVRSYAEANRWPFILGTADVQAFSRQEHTSLEEAARILRYRFLGKEALSRNISCIAVGHTADDQAETVLMHFLRGAGPNGMRGMLPKTDLAKWLPEFPPRTIFIIRPMLSVRRSQTEGYCRDRQLHPVQDVSNLDNTFWRNRIRNELMPILETYNPQAAHVMVRFAGIMQTQQDFLYEATTSIWKDTVSELTDGSVAIHRAPFLLLHRALQQEVIRRVFGSLNPSLRDIAHSHIEMAISFVENPTFTGHIQIAVGIQMDTEGEVIIVSSSKTKKMIVAWEGLEIPSTGITSLECPAWDISSEIMEKMDGQINWRTADGYQAYLDKDTIILPLMIRRHRPGELFTPLGMKKPMRLIDFLTNQHIPRRVRADWPLLCDQQGVIWVPGYRTAERTKITDSTVGILHLSIVVDRCS